MLVESASLDTVFTLVYIVTVGINSPLQNVFLPILGQIQVSSIWGQSILSPTR